MGGEGNELETVRAFVARERRARWIEALGHPTRRRKVLSTLAHDPPLEYRHGSRIPPSEQSPDGIHALLEERGAPERCWLLSESEELDGRGMDLREALRAVVGRGMGTLVSCVPGRLMYYEGEEPGERYVFERSREERGGGA